MRPITHWRALVPVTVVSVLAAVGPAYGKDIKLTAKAGARLQVSASHLGGRPIRVTVDGRRMVVRRRTTISVNGLARPLAEWHVVRVHGSRRTASARFAVGVRHGRHSPTLILTGAPPRVTSAGTSRLTYTSSGGRISCRLDGQPAACSRRSATVTVGAGRHVFALRAQVGASSTSLAWTWTASGTGATTPPPPSTGAAPAAPADGPAPVDPPVNTAPSSNGAGAGPAAGGRLLVADSFDGNSLNAATWQTYGPNWAGNGGNGLRDGSAVSVGGGVLTITAKMVGGTLVSGAIASRISTTYGRVEFRVRADPDPSQATSAVVLMWPTSDNWPIDGETDIFETGPAAARSSFTSFVHYGASNQQVWFPHHVDATQWHTMAMDWTPSRLSFYLDGALDGEVTDAAVISDAAQHLCIQLDATQPTMTGTVRMQVDDVRVYSMG
jgi:hypothetical protein